MSSGSFSTVDGDSWADKYFPDSSDEIWQDFHHLRPIFVTSPEQPPRILFFCEQVVNNPFSVYDTLDCSQDHSTYAHSHYNGSQASVDQTRPYRSATESLQCPPVLAVPAYGFPFATGTSTTYPPKLPGESFHYGFSLRPDSDILIAGAVNLASGGSDGHLQVDEGRWTVCGAQITSATIPEHLATHGIKKMTGNFRLECRWLECRLRGDRKEMNRESIVRHTTELPKARTGFL
ncbi:hypothetical protein EV363DRAFT_1296122 [Boletus edulis]|nr:hypothetical protein EV363DRAFT_1296122 [Boletus edulis]